MSEVVSQSPRKVTITVPHRTPSIPVQPNSNSLPSTPSSPPVTSWFASAGSVRPHSINWAQPMSSRSSPSGPLQMPLSYTLLPSPKVHGRVVTVAKASEMPKDKEAALVPRDWAISQGQMHVKGTFNEAENATVITLEDKQGEELRAAMNELSKMQQQLFHMLKEHEKKMDVKPNVQVTLKQVAKKPVEPSKKNSFTRHFYSFKSESQAAAFADAEGKYKGLPIMVEGSSSFYKRTAPMPVEINAPYIGNFRAPSTRPSSLSSSLGASAENSSFLSLELSPEPSHEQLFNA